MTEPLDELSRLHGLVAPPTPDGAWTAELTDTSKRAVLSALGVDPQAGDAIEEARALAPTRLAAPRDRRCFTPQWMADGRAWGVAVQLYEIRSRRNWGIGDFADLEMLAPLLAATGADFLGLNPLHALFGAEPERASPFSPSNRRFLNPIYIAVDRVDGFAALDLDQDRLDALRAADLVDYAGVTAAKHEALQLLWQAGARDGDFDTFIDEGGEALRLHCLFEALSLRMAAEGHGAGWRGWPAAYHDHTGPAVADFARANAGAVRFQQWLQYLCDRQLASAQRVARGAGMRIGLYLDLAVGEAPDGSASWSDPGDYLASAHVGAPPDMFTTAGQNWGLTGLSPLRVRQSRGEALRPTYEAAMRHAGAVRLDHAMGIWQLFLIPEGRPAAEGAYARLPAEEVIAILADLSQRYRTILVGEDLGVVPEGFREVLADAGILSYRVLYFEQGADGFTEANAYPKLALACIATHDLPTMKGWWAGGDIDLRERFGLVAAEDAATQRENRRTERQALLRLLWPQSDLRAAMEEIPPELVIEAHRFIARTPARLAVARFADLTGEADPTNVPGTSDDYPNWKIKCEVPIEELAAAPLFGPVTAAMRRERPRQR